MGRESYWHRIFPELMVSETREQRRVAWQKATKHSLRGLVLYALSAVVITSAITIPLALLVRFGRPPVRIPPMAIGVAVGMSVSMIGPSVTFLLFRRRIQRSLRRQLVEIGKPVCMTCGYDLRGQTMARCPECGTEFDEALLNHTLSRLDR